MSREARATAGAAPALPRGTPGVAESVHALLRSVALGRPQSASRLRLWNFLKLTQGAIFPDPIPWETLAIHRDVDSGRQDLDEGKRAAKIEKTIGAPEGIGYHRPGKNNRFVGYRASDFSRGLGHGVGAMSNDNSILR